MCASSRSRPGRPGERVGRVVPVRVRRAVVLLLVKVASSGRVHWLKVPPSPSFSLSSLSFFFMLVNAREKHVQASTERQHDRFALFSMSNPLAESAHSLPDLTIEFPKISADQLLLVRRLKAHPCRVASIARTWNITHPKVQLEFLEALPCMTALRTLNLQCRAQCFVFLLLVCVLKYLRGHVYAHAFFADGCYSLRHVRK